MIPAYLPNPFAAVFGGGKPIDGGRTLKDGRRIIGDGKTYRGLFSGIFFGVLAGNIQIWLSSRGFEILGIEMPSFGPQSCPSTCLRLAFRRYGQELLQAQDGPEKRSSASARRPTGLCNRSLGLCIPYSAGMVCKQFYARDNDNNSYNYTSAAPYNECNRILYRHKERTVVILVR